MTRHLGKMSDSDGDGDSVGAFGFGDDEAGGGGGANVLKPQTSASKLSPRKGSVSGGKAKGSDGSSKSAAGGAAARGGALRWPDPFPKQLVGRSWAEIEGHTIVRERVYSDFEMHPDAETYPNLARMTMKATIVKSKHPASGYQVGSFYVHQHYLKIDRGLKAATKIGTVDIDSQGENYGISDEPEESAGEWTWHTERSDFDNLQMAFNANNTVFRVVNFANPAVKESGDITKNIQFFFVDDAADRVEGVATELLPLPENQIGERLEKLGKYFESKDTAFLTTPAVSAKDIGKRVGVKGHDSAGVIRSFGEEKDTDKIVVGVELDTDSGEHNGTVEGHAYFTCAGKRGVLVPLSHVIRQRAVQYSVVIKSINQIDTLLERFEATLEVEFTYPITKLDIVNYGTLAG